jgi:hypothetical protein
MSDQKFIQAKLERMSGLRPDEVENMHKAQEKQDDWFGFCRKCKAKLQGTPAQLREHVCGVKG